MIRINLLPHREEKRRQNKKAFYTLLVLFATVGAVIVLMVGAVFATKIGFQESRNHSIEEENKRLDDKIKEIANLKQEIEALKARQQAVEDLQGDRNQPVYLMDELVKQTPEGVHFKSFKQDGQRIAMTGYAQSMERFSDLLRNFSNSSPWLERPELTEIKSATLGSGKGAKPVFEFTLNVGIKRPRDKDKQNEVVKGAPGKPGEGAGPDVGAMPPPVGVPGRPPMPAGAGNGAPPPAAASGPDGSAPPKNIFDVHPSAVGKKVESALAKSPKPE